MLKKVKNFIFDNLPIILILGVASFLRFFRLKSLLGFWYDQGRDALVVWDLIHKGKFFLIGPTTGIEGVFRGPWYYWLIAPFYYLGRGNPIWPAVFLFLLSVVAIYILYKVGTKLGGKTVGIVAAFIASVSVYIVDSSRWLSNPTPMLPIGILLIWSIFKFLDRKKWALPLTTFLIGMALNFGSAMEVFYIPVVLAILIYKRSLLPKAKIIILSLFLFVFAFLPQILFEIRHPGVLSGAIINFLKDNSFSVPLGQFLLLRIKLYYSLILSIFISEKSWLFAPFAISALLLLIFKWKEFWRDDRFKTVFVFFVTPFIGGLFFSGNNGTIYNYYFTGYYFVFILFFSYLITKFKLGALGKIIAAIFLLLIAYFNVYGYLKSYVLETKKINTVTFSQQLQAIDWIYKSAEGKDFNVDVYVPPVIPHAYDYLFTWLGETKYGEKPLTENVNLLYTLYEIDIDHPERLDAWLERQKGIGTVISEEKFDMIVVQERERIKEK